MVVPHTLQTTFKARVCVCVTSEKGEGVYTGRIKELDTIN